MFFGGYIPISYTSPGFYPIPDCHNISSRRLTTHDQAHDQAHDELLFHTSSSFVLLSFSTSTTANPQACVRPDCASNVQQLKGSSSKARCARAIPPPYWWKPTYPFQAKGAIAQSGQAILTALYRDIALLGDPYTVLLQCRDTSSPRSYSCTTYKTSAYC